MQPDLQRRAAVLAEAETWLGTPFHHAARVKGAGVDCLMFLAEVYERAGITGHIDPGFYVPDWHLHRGVELYLKGLLEYGREIDAPGPGDVALFKFGRAFSHGAIVVEWPTSVIHALFTCRMVIKTSAEQHPLRGQAVRFFTPF